MVKNLVPKKVDNLVLRTVNNLVPRKVDYLLVLVRRFWCDCDVGLEKAPKWLELGLDLDKEAGC